MGGSRKAAKPPKGVSFAPWRLGVTLPVFPFRVHRCFIGGFQLPILILGCVIMALFIWAESDQVGSSRIQPDLVGFWTGVEFTLAYLASFCCISQLSVFTTACHPAACCFFIWLRFAKTRFHHQERCES